MTTNGRPDDRLEASLRQWGRRGPATPAATAARALVARLATPPPPRRWPRRVAVATAASVVGLAAWLMLGQPSGPSPTPVDLPPPLPENVVLFWLDPDTPVYFVTGPPESVKRGSP